MTWARAISPDEAQMAGSSHAGMGRDCGLEIPELLRGSFILNSLRFTQLHTRACCLRGRARAQRT